MPGGSVSRWTSQQGEPRIRVGVVLPSDGMRSIRLEIPGGYEVHAINRDLGPASPGEAEVAVDGVAVRFTPAGADRSWSGEIVRLEPAEPQQARQGAGVCLHDLVTGRGFHWQKRVSFSMLGTLEFRAIDGCLLVVNELGLEDYLHGVITAEMSGECPLEFLKSQCIVARSWVLAYTEPKHTQWPIDRCNDDCCQRYHGTSYWTERAANAVTATCGQVVTDAAGHIIDANYSKNCGGIIEAPEHVWFVSKMCQRVAVDAPKDSHAQRFLPLNAGNLNDYLVGDWLRGTDVFCSPNVVPDRDLSRYLGSVDEGGGHFRWTVEYSRGQLEQLLCRKLSHVFVDPPRATASVQAVLVADLPPHVPDARMPAPAALQDVRVTKHGPSGRASELETLYADAAGHQHLARVRSEYRIREVLHEKFLYSSAFRVEIERDEQGLPVRVRLVGAGWGHGAGLCQIGALGMAIKGYSCRAILEHYFEGVQVRAFY